MMKLGLWTTVRHIIFVTKKSGLKLITRLTTITLLLRHGSHVKALGRGSTEIEAVSSGRWKKFLLTNVWLVPNISKNLFSLLAAQDHRPLSRFESTIDSCRLFEGKETLVSGYRKKCGGLYKLAIRAVPATRKCESENNNLSNSNKGHNLLQLFHERLAHQNKRHVKEVIKRELNLDIPIDGELCEGCINGKAHRLKFGLRKRAEKSGELIHTDLCGPFISSKSGFKYFLVFKDDFSRFRKIYFIKNKDEVANKLKEFLVEANVTGHVIKCILSDNGGEFNNKEVHNILKSKGIDIRYTMPYTPEQNGCAERENRTIVEAARALMHSGQESLPKELWAEMVNTAAYILNRTGPSSVKDKSPYELWLGRKPRIKHLRVIGSKCWVHIPKVNRRKFDKKAQEGVLVGYDGDNGYRIFTNNKLLRSRDVIFLESLRPPVIEETSSHPIKERKISINIDEEEQEEEKPDVQEDREEKQMEEESDDSEINQENEEDATWRRGVNLRNINKLNKPKYLQDYVNIVEGSERIPMTFYEAIEGEDAEQWQKAMEAEMTSLKENKTWTLCKLPPNKKVIASKWVFTKKYSADGSLNRYKARLVVKGFAQKKGEDFEETFSPVARGATIRTVISVAANENMFLYQFDVSTAFLNGELKEEIYISQPEGFKDNPGKVCKLNKSLYGLKQAPRCWNEKMKTFLLDAEFTISTADPCLFIKNVNGNKILLVLYVDDGLIAASDEKEALTIIEELKREFKIKTKPADYYLGMEIKRSKEGIKISQAFYTKKLLQKFQMEECRPVSTPILKDENSESRNNILTNKVKDFPYREAVGSLMYLMTGTRPDISYAVSVVSRTLDNPSEQDIVRVKRIFRYLKGTSELGIFYKKNHNKGFLECYSDADLGGDIQTGRSTTGIVCLYSGGSISWFSKRQVSVAISTTEAEVIAASEGTREMIWLKRLLEEISDYKEGVLFVDNNAAIKLAENPVWHKRTKHISIRHFFVREKVQEGEMKIRRVDTQNQLADGCTKPLLSPRLKRLNQDLGLS